MGLEKPQVVLSKQDQHTSCNKYSTHVLHKDSFNRFQVSDLAMVSFMFEVPSRYEFVTARFTIESARFPVGLFVPHMDLVYAMDLDWNHISFFVESTATPVYDVLRFLAMNVVFWIHQRVLAIELLFSPSTVACLW